jgi:hypothetical protein
MFVGGLLFKGIDDRNRKRLPRLMRLVVDRGPDFTHNLIVISTNAFRSTQKGVMLPVLIYRNSLRQSQEPSRQRLF